MAREAKVKVVASFFWGEGVADFVQFLAALAVLPRSIGKNRMNSTVSTKLFTLKTTLSPMVSRPASRTRPIATNRCRVKPAPPGSGWLWQGRRPGLNSSYFQFVTIVTKLTVDYKLHSTSFLGSGKVQGYLWKPY